MFRVFFTLYVNLISINIIFVYISIYFHSDRIWALNIHVFHSLGSSIRKMNHLIFKPDYPALSNIMKRINGRIQLQVNKGQNLWFIRFRIIFLLLELLIGRL
jgi:hypothetical protein